jgi:hypothetical protein
MRPVRKKDRAEEKARTKDAESRGFNHGFALGPGLVKVPTGMPAYLLRRSMYG